MSQEENIREALKVYDRINKTRPLEPHEEERVAYLTKRLKMIPKQEIYRKTERGRQVNLKSATKYARSEKGKACRRRWYANSPDASEKAVERVRQWRIRKRAERDAGMNEPKPEKDLP